MKVRIAGLALTLISMFSFSQAQAAFPDRPIRLVIPFAAGGGGDVAGRAVAEDLSISLGKPVIVENKPGAQTQIGTQAVTAAPADGYTLLLMSGDIAAIDIAYKMKRPYDVQRDLSLIGGVASIPLVLIASNGSKIKSLPDLIEKAKARPGALNFASLGPNSPHFLFFSWFKKKAGIQINDIPYKSTSQATIDLIGNRVDLTMIGEVSAASNSKAGHAIPIATTSESRGKILTNIPTFTSYDPELHMDNWYAIAVPAGVPENIQRILESHLKAAVQSESTRQRLATLGLSPWWKDREELRTYFKAQITHYTEIVAKASVF